VQESSKDHFLRQGFYFPVPVFDAGEAKSLFHRFEKQATSLVGAGHENPHLREHWILEITRNPKVLKFIEQILGPDFFCMNSRFFAKHAGGPEFVSWHQDGTYCGLENPRDMITGWVAFTEVTVNSGAVKMLPGTHDRQRPHEDTHARENMLTRGQQVATAVDESSAIDVVLKPGEASFHHPYVVHGSPPNRSPGPRIGLGIQYMATRAVPLRTFEGKPILVQGRDDFGHFTEYLAEELP
jgi:non-haem Fe2+, alpha-ketoglutarate-dependent halogenase